jgi:hypothetical protein
MNEMAFAVSRQSAPFRLHLRALRSHRWSIFLRSLCIVALLLAISTGRHADLVPARARTHNTPVVARHGGEPHPSPSVIAREAAARSAMLRPATDTARARNRFEPEPVVDGRPGIVVVCNPTHQAFSGPLWRFLLNEPVQPDIDFSHNQTYYGVKVTVPFGG